MKLALLLIAFFSNKTWASCDRSAFARENNTINYPPGSKVEVSSFIDITPDSAYLVSLNGGSPELQRSHRLNGDEFYFEWPENSTFVEGASPRDNQFFVKLHFHFRRSPTFWDFYPPGPNTTLWRSILARLDGIIDVELQRGAIDEKLAHFAKNYHYSIMNRHVSHIFIQGEGDGSRWDSLSIVHGDQRGGIFGGPFADLGIEESEQTLNPLQIELNFPDLVLNERKIQGPNAEVYEFIRLGGLSQNKLTHRHFQTTMSRLAPVVARHLAQKHGYLGFTNPHAGIYLLAPTPAHQRLYERFFSSWQIPLQSFAEVGEGFVIYRLSAQDFVTRFTSVYLASQ